MIPLRLYIKNFLSYGSTVQTINFEPYHLICLSGKNGHGKSALLDALTWALWGQARKTLGVAKADANLLRLGQQHMMVALDFSCNGNIYRVRREYTYDRTKPISYLDFGVRDVELETLKPLTQKTIRETQELINTTIGLDHAAFESSAFLRQGNSDEFSRKSAKDRKEVIGNILGLGTYEILRKKIVERGRASLLKQQHSAHTCGMLRSEVAVRIQVEEELAIIHQQYSITAEKLEQQNAQYRTCIAEKKKLVLKVQAIKESLLHAEHLENSIKGHKTILQTEWLLWRSIHKKKLSSLQQHISIEKKERLKSELARLQAQFKDQLRFSAEVMQHKKELEAITTALKAESLGKIQPLEKEIARNRQQAMLAQHDLAATTVSLQEAEALHAQLQEENSAALHIFEAQQELEEYVKKEEHVLELLRNNLQRAVQLQHRLSREEERIQQETKKITEHAALACPTCFQSISQEHVLYVLKHHADSVRRSIHQKKRISRLIEQYQEQSKKIHEGLQVARKKNSALMQTIMECRARRQQQDQCKKLQDILCEKIIALTQKIETLNVEHAEQIKKIESLETHHAGILKNHGPSIVLKQQIAEKESLMEHAAEQQSLYYAIEEEFQKITQAEEEQARFLQSASQQKERSIKIHTVCQEIRRIRNMMPNGVQLADELKKIDAQLHDLESEEESLQKLQLQIGQQKEHLAAQRGALEQRLRDITQKDLSLSQESVALKRLEEETSDYAMLAQILSKDGIQGMLIEHVLPEIEQEANTILAKLTDNQAHLKFESTRELKNGSAKETLDIKISDSLGIRPYELFSGGEAFRIDFALRLAISKLLARRAGASIQTLIIDEGFGSQDEEGLQNIMESLYAIQNEFAKIIIVSHLPSMKDQFPIHFYIQKGAQGSTVTVLEQG